MFSPPLIALTIGMLLFNAVVNSVILGITLSSTQSILTVKISPNLPETENLERHTVAMRN